MQFLADVQRTTGTSCTPAAFVSRATISRFAAYLAESAEASSHVPVAAPQSPLVHLRDGGSKTSPLLFSPRGRTDKVSTFV